MASIRNGYHEEWQVLNRPMKVHWDGFVSDTLTLQRRGWSVQVHEDQRAMVTMEALKHQRAAESKIEVVESVKIITFAS
jgi:hypothetical protein